MLSSVMNLKKLCLTAVAGTLFVVVIWLTFDAWRYLARSPLPSTVAVAKPLIGFQTDPSWVRSGSPNFHNVELVRSSDGNTISGLWSCEGPSTFEWTYYMDETIYLLEGLIEIEYPHQRPAVLPGPGGDLSCRHQGPLARTQSCQESLHANSAPTSRQALAALVSNGHKS